MSYPFIPLKFRRLSPQRQMAKARRFLKLMEARRTVRDFSTDPLPDGLIELLLQTANCAPSGANKQPWTFVLVKDPKIKKQIRMAAEKEEKQNYEGRFSEEWLRDLAPLGTDWNKPFLEEAPCLIVMFRQDYGLKNGEKSKHYYVMESAGIAAGFLLTAIHNAGLVALTHTPSPMGFLQQILNRPKNEKPFLLIPVGYPKEDARIPDIHRKQLEDTLINI